MSEKPPVQNKTVEAAEKGMRLDRWVAANWPEVSRARVQELIEQGLVLVNGAIAKPAQKLRGGERINVEILQRPPLRAEPESIPLAVVYEDDDLLIVNKPAAMSVHAGAGESAGTLVNALLGRGQSLSRGGSGEPDKLRPGIVHRLDKETSGLIVVAKNDFAHARLAEAFRARAVKKSYLALAEGHLETANGKIDFPIGRDPIRRTRMKAYPPSAKSSRRSLPDSLREALTEWHRLIDFGPATLLLVQLHTGRTHQIRVHFSAIKHPLVGDALYGAAGNLRVGKTELHAPSRQFLHAARLGFPHPRSGRWIEARAPLPDDLREFLELLGKVANHDLAPLSEYLE
jgi:23S rRNA pseudouridine1911/1915/1917 synthase